MTRTDMGTATRADLDARTDLILTGAVAALFRGKATELRALAETLTPADHTRAIALALGMERLASRVQAMTERVAGFTVMAPARAGRTPDGPGDVVTLPGACASVPPAVPPCTCVRPQLILEGDVTEVCPKCHGVRHAGFGPAKVAPYTAAELGQIRLAAPFVGDEHQLRMVATLAAAAAELRSALADQRDRGASSHEVAKRVEAVAKMLRGEGT